MLGPTLLKDHLFGQLRLNRTLKRRFSRLKRRQPILEFGNFLVDSSQFGLRLHAHQIFWANLFSYIRFQLTPKHPKIRVAPHRSFSIFNISGLDTLHDEISCHPIFLLRRYIAENCAFAIPFAMFRHVRPDIDRAPSHSNWTKSFDFAQALPAGFVPAMSSRNCKYPCRCPKAERVHQKESSTGTMKSKPSLPTRLTSVSRIRRIRVGESFGPDI